MSKNRGSQPFYRPRGLCLRERQQAQQKASRRDDTWLDCSPPTRIRNFEYAEERKLIRNEKSAIRRIASSDQNRLVDPVSAVDCLKVSGLINVSPLHHVLPLDAFLLEFRLGIRARVPQIARLAGESPSSTSHAQNCVSSWSDAFLQSLSGR